MAVDDYLCAEELLRGHAVASRKMPTVTQNFCHATYHGSARWFYWLFAASRRRRHTVMLAYDFSLMPFRRRMLSHDSPMICGGRSS